MTCIESGLTTPEQVGGITGAGMPEGLYEAESHNIDGHRVWAHWVWCQYSIDFRKQDSEWKIWHFRCLEAARAPYGENWITFASKKQELFAKDLAYFDKDGRPVFMPLPDESAVKRAEIYAPNRLRKLDVALLSPYNTFSDVVAY